jgi:predicted aldo/keto reductase-like oxidoreductase
LKEEGLIRFIGISSHNRRLFPVLAEQGEIDVFHLRYNAVNRGAEEDVFPHLPVQDRPGIVSFTATRWGRLLNQKKMPPGEKAPTARDCYRFVLSNPHIDICMMGARTGEQMRENLKVLDDGPLSEAEMVHMRKIGDYLYKGGRR